MQTPPHSEILVFHVNLLRRSNCTLFPLLSFIEMSYKPHHLSLSNSFFPYIPIFVAVTKSLTSVNV